MRMLSSDFEDASWSITFHKFPCPDGDTVEFSIDAVLESELGNMSSVAVTGCLTAALATPPQ